MRRPENRTDKGSGVVKRFISALETIVRSRNVSSFSGCIVLDRNRIRTQPWNSFERVYICVDSLAPIGMFGAITQLWHLN